MRFLPVLSAVVGLVLTLPAVALAGEGYDTKPYKIPPSVTLDKNYGLPTFGMPEAGLPRQRTQAPAGRPPVANAPTANAPVANAPVANGGGQPDFFKNADGLGSSRKRAADVPDFFAGAPDFALPKTRKAAGDETMETPRYTTGEDSAGGDTRRNRFETGDTPSDETDVGGREP